MDNKKLATHLDGLDAYGPFTEAATRNEPLAEIILVGLMNSLDTVMLEQLGATYDDSFQWNQLHTGQYPLAYKHHLGAEISDDPEFKDSEYELARRVVTSIIDDLIKWFGDPR